MMNHQTQIDKKPVNESGDKVSEERPVWQPDPSREDRVKINEQNPNRQDEA